MHVERVLREYGQFPRPMNEAPRDGTRILGHHPRSGRLILCYWETIPEALVGPIWVDDTAALKLLEQACAEASRAAVRPNSALLCPCGTA
jgi:hypothetical protein